MRAFVLLLLIATRVFAHGGTSHSSDMAVDNQLVVAREAVTLTQVHTCQGKMAADLWAATDVDSDGQLSAAELAKCVEDSRTVYQQWCRVEVDWKTVLPTKVDVKLASFPNTRPTTFTGAPLVIEHVATYPVDAGGVKNLAVNCTSLNARTIKSLVRCEPGLRIETSSIGKVTPGGTEVTGILQQDGSPDQFGLVVVAGDSAPRARPAASGGPEVEGGFGIALIFFGVYYLVGSCVSYGRARALQAPGSLGAIASGFGVIFLGIAMSVHALIAAGIVVIRL